MNDDSLINKDILFDTGDVVGKNQYTMNSNRVVGNDRSDVIDCALNVLGNVSLVENDNPLSTFQESDSIGSMNQYSWDHPIFQAPRPLDADSHKSGRDSSKDCTTATSASLTCDPKQFIEHNTKAFLPWQSQQRQRQRQRGQSNDVTPEASERSETSTRSDANKNNNNNNNIHKHIHYGGNPITGSVQLTRIPLLRPILWSASEGIKNCHPLDTSLNQEKIQGSGNGSSSERGGDTMIDIDDELSAAEFHPETTPYPMKPIADININDDLSFAEFDVLTGFDPLPITNKTSHSYHGIAKANAPAPDLNFTSQGGPLPFQQQSVWQKHYCDASSPTRF